MPHFPPEVNIFRFFYCYMYFFILYINMQCTAVLEADTAVTLACGLNLALKVEASIGILKAR